MPTTRILAAFAALLLSAGVARAAPPTVLTYSGFLFDSAGTTPLSGVHDFYFSFWTQSVGGTRIGPVSPTEIQLSTTVGTDGYFSVVIDVSSIANDPLFESQMYMAVRVDNDVNAMTPRIQVSSVPSALSVPYSGITGFTAAIPCAAGQFATGFDVNGNFVCDTPAGGVTGITAGAGLTGGGTGAVNLGLQAGGVTFSHLAQSGCTSGQIPKWNGTAWACAADANSGGTVTSVTTGSGLTGGPISTTGTIAIASGGVAFSHLAQNGCTAGQIPKWNGTAWACAADNDTNSGGTVTSVATGVGLTGGPITTSGTVAVSFAGTGALNTVARSDHTHSSRTAGVQVTNFASTVAVNSELSEATLLTLPTTNAAGNGVALTAHTTIERGAASTSYLYVYIRRAPCDTGLAVGFVSLRGASQGIAGETWISEVISITGFDASAPANTTYVLCAKKFMATSPNGTAYGRGMIATW